MEFRIEGTEEFYRKINELAGKVTKDNLYEAAFKSANNIVVPYAKSICPVDTGRLRDSIKAKIDEDGVSVFTSVPYAPYVEFGTVKMAAQPFMYPALKDKEDEVISDMRETISKLVEVNK